jgi:DNA polymerase/3'-5' exonuclease PolX
MDYNNAKKLVTQIKKVISGLFITGSVKRKSQQVNDIDFITMKNLDDVLDMIIKKYINVTILKNGNKHLSLILDNYDIQIDFWKADNKTELFYKRLLRDLDKGHTIYYRKQARKAGYKLSEIGLYDSNNELVTITNKKELKKLLGIK